MSNTEVHRRLTTVDKLIPPGTPSRSRWADWFEQTLSEHGLIVISPYQDEELAERIKALIFERTQLVDADADDLAWDIVQVMRGETDE